MFTHLEVVLILQAATDPRMGFARDYVKMRRKTRDLQKELDTAIR